MFAPRIRALGATLAAAAAISLGVTSGDTAASAATGATVSVGPAATVVETTANLRDALTPLPDLSFSSSAPHGIPTVSVDDARSFQRFKGVGAAMTDSSAWLIHDELDASAQAAVMASLFGPTGIRLNFIRVPIGASDFTAGRRPYSYDDMPPNTTDPALLHFSIAHDEPYVLPTLRQALALDPGALVLANPWSPPGWMKTNDSLSNTGDDGRLRSSDYGPLARYFVKFLKAYAAAGVTIGAITPQNEPGQGTLYPGLNLNERGEARLITGNLVPALARAGLQTQIYGYDYGWSSQHLGFARGLSAGPAAGDLTGLATHCYFGTPTAMSALHALDPNLDEIESECSPGITPYSVTELEIASLRNWASAVALWNLALEPNGEPVQPPNFGCPHCTGVVTIDPKTHRARPTLSYYQLGQVSKFVDPGAVRIASNTFVRYSYPGKNRNVASPGLDDVAFRNPDGSEVLIAYDNSRAPITFAVDSHGSYASLRLAAGATVTLKWAVGSTAPAG